jgi:signal transduction histidine kinase
MLLARQKLGFRHYGLTQWVVAVSILAGFLAVDLTPDGPFNAAQDWLFDTYQQLWPAQRLGSRAVVVEINDESVRRVGQWPWPRDILAAVISAARDADAIGVDVLMPDADRLSPDHLLEQRHVESSELRQALLSLPHTDELLAGALRPLPAVLAMTAGDEMNGPPQPFGITPVRERGDSARVALLHVAKAEWPLAILANAAHGIGVVSASRTRLGEIATLPAAIETGGSVLPGFGMELLRVALNADAIVLDSQVGRVSSVSIGALSIPTDASGAIRPRFIGPSHLQTIGADRLLDGVDRSLLSHRIVLIGVTASGVGETFRIPLGTQEFSAAIQAELIESVIAGDTLWRPFWARPLERGVGIILGLSAGLLLGRIRYWVYSATFCGIAVLIVAGSVLAFRQHGVLLNCIFPIFCLVGVDFAALALRVGNEVAARRQREAELRVALVERTAAERELALRTETDTLRQSLALAVDAASLGVWDADVRKRRWRHSARHDEILGLTVAPVCWSKDILLERVVAEDRTMAASRLADAEVSGSLEVDCRISHPDGSLRDVHIVGRFWKSEEDGVIERVAGVVADMTRPREMEARLRQSEKMQAVGLLAGGVAHNFNNLLAVVLGSLELALRASDASSRQGVHLDRAVRAARKGADIVRHLLTFARLQPLNPKLADPANLLHEMCLLLQDSLPSNVQVTLRLPAGLGNIKIDPVEFELALLNLAMNARDAMPDGGQLVIQASTEQTRDPRLGLDGQYLVVEVADTGQGIAPDARPNVFEPFFTTKEVGKGTGLGLSQVYGFVHQSGGAVDIDSTPGRGTRVRLYLPTAELDLTPVLASSAD